MFTEHSLWWKLSQLQTILPLWESPALGFPKEARALTGAWQSLMAEGVRKVGCIYSHSQIIINLINHKRERVWQMGALLCEVLWMVLQGRGSLRLGLLINTETEHVSAGLWVGWATVMTHQLTKATSVSLQLTGTTFFSWGLTLTSHLYLLTCLNFTNTHEFPTSLLEGKLNIST